MCASTVCVHTSLKVQHIGLFIYLRVYSFKLDEFSSEKKVKFPLHALSVQLIYFSSGHRIICHTMAAFYLWWNNACLLFCTFFTSSVTDTQTSASRCPPASFPFCAHLLIKPMWGWNSVLTHTTARLHRGPGDECNWINRDWSFLNWTQASSDVWNAST